MKDISIDTLRLKKRNLSLFLTVLIFSCLLFMEGESSESRERRTYVKVRIDLGRLLDRLRDLKIKIDKREVIITGTIDDKIDRLIQLVEDARRYLEVNVPTKEIRKNVNIFPEVLKIEDDLSRFSKQSHHSSDELDIFLSEIEKIWKEQIYEKIRKAILNASR